MRTDIHIVTEHVPEVGDLVYFWSGCAGAEIQSRIMKITKHGILVEALFYDGYGNNTWCYPIDYFRWSEKNQGWLFYWYSNQDGWWPSVNWDLDGKSILQLRMEKERKRNE